jgi:hypothetical protein
MQVMFVFCLFNSSIDETYDVTCPDSVAIFAIEVTVMKDTLKLQQSVLLFNDLLSDRRNSDVAQLT